MSPVVRHGGPQNIWFLGSVSSVEDGINHTQTYPYLSRITVPNLVTLRLTWECEIRLSKILAHCSLPIKYVDDIGPFYTF